MKISIADLKKAIVWIETNTNETHVTIKWVDNMVISCKDKYDAIVEIKLSENNMLPRLVKEDFL
jgi:hypothetical protein